MDPTMSSIPLKCDNTTETMNDGKKLSDAIHIRLITNPAPKHLADGAWKYLNSCFLKCHEVELSNVKRRQKVRCKLLEMMCHKP